MYNFGKNDITKIYEIYVKWNIIVKIDSTYQLIVFPRAIFIYEEIFMFKVFDLENVYSYMKPLYLVHSE